MFKIREERPADKEAVNEINLRAFGRAEEAVVVDRIRDRGGLVISLVALKDEMPIGYIAFTDIILEPEYPGFKAITLGPVAVLPEFQKQGAGKGLIRAELELCRRKGYDIVLLAGHPSYYQALGFKTVDQSKLSCEYEIPTEAFMVMELTEGALSGKKTLVKFQPEFREAV